MDIESKIHHINNLKEERNLASTGLRWNVKPIWQGNNTSQFKQLREKLTIKSNARLLAATKE